MSYLPDSNGFIRTETGFYRRLFQSKYILTILVLFELEEEVQNLVLVITKPEPEIDIYHNSGIIIPKCDCDFCEKIYKQFRDYLF